MKRVQTKGLVFLLRACINRKGSVSIHRISTPISKLALNLALSFALIMTLIVPLSGCNEIFEDQGTIIGNPDFVPEFQHVNIDTFIGAYTTELSGLGLPSDYVILEEKESFDEVYLINDAYTLRYDNGFIKMTFTSDDYDAVFDEAILYLKALMFTLDPETTEDAFDESITDIYGPEGLTSDVPWNDIFFYGDTVMYNFDVTDDGVYGIYAEDERMGH